MGFRGSKKNTPYAAQMAAQDCAKTAYDLGLRKVKAYVKGPGNGRESAIRTIHGAGIEVVEIIDVTPVPFMAQATLCFQLLVSKSTLISTKPGAVSGLRRKQAPAPAQQTSETPSRVNRPYFYHLSMVAAAPAAESVTTKDSVQN